MLRRLFNAPKRFVLDRLQKQRHKTVTVSLFYVDSAPVPTGGQKAIAVKDEVDPIGEYLEIYADPHLYK